MAVARVALVAGATGLVGREVIAALLAAENAPGTASLDGPPIHILHAAGRRAPAALARNVVVHAVDFSALPSLPPVDDVYIALGTTMAAAGGQNAFRAIDYSAVLATAQAARRAGATRCGVVSAMGADPQSRIFYSRIKGEMERDLQALGHCTAFGAGRQQTTAPPDPASGRVPFAGAPAVAAPAHPRQLPCRGCARCGTCTGARCAAWPLGCAGAVRSCVAIRLIGPWQGPRGVRRHAAGSRRS